MECKKCNKVHVGSFGSGIFCSKSCANSRNQTSPEMREKRREIGKRINKKEWIKIFSKKEFVKNCIKCGTEFTVLRSEKNNFKIPKKERICCYSTKCVNGHILSEASKEKIRKKLKKEEIVLTKICKICKNLFSTTNRKSKKFCSPVCHGKYSARVVKKEKSYDSEKRSIAARKAYADGKNYVAGGTTKWLNYKSIKVQGTYELRTCFILDSWKEKGLIIDWQYTNDRFPYIDIEGKYRTYILDFKVFNLDDSFYYIETKGFERENDKLKWKAVRDLGIKLLVWFNEDIKKEEKMEM